MERTQEGAATLPKHTPNPRIPVKYIQLERVPTGQIQAALNVTGHWSLVYIPTTEQLFQKTLHNTLLLTCSLSGSRVPVSTWKKAKCDKHTVNPLQCLGRRSPTAGLFLDAHSYETQNIDRVLLVSLSGRVAWWQHALLA